MARFHGFLAVQSRGTVALPPAVRRHLGLDRPGAQLEVTERPDGVLEMRAVLPVPAAEMWYWEPAWQEGEREVDAHVRAGRVSTFTSPDEFLSHLDSLG